PLGTARRSPPVCGRSSHPRVRAVRAGREPDAGDTGRGPLLSAFDVAVGFHVPVSGHAGVGADDRRGASAHALRACDTRSASQGRRRALRRARDAAGSGVRASRHRGGADGLPTAARLTPGASLMEGRRLVVAPGRRLGGVKGENPFVRPSRTERRESSLRSSYGPQRDRRSSPGRNSSVRKGGLEPLRRRGKSISYGTGVTGGAPQGPPRLLPVGELRAATGGSGPDPRRTTRLSRFR